MAERIARRIEHRPGRLNQQDFVVLVLHEPAQVRRILTDQEEVAFQAFEKSRACDAIVARHGRMFDEVAALLTFAERQVVCCCPAGRPAKNGREHESFRQRRKSGCHSPFDAPRLDRAPIDATHKLEPLPS